MRKMKQGLAAVMAALLMVPAQPAMAASPQLSSYVLETAAKTEMSKKEDTVKTEAGKKEEKSATPGNAQKEEEKEVSSKNEGTSSSTGKKPQKTKSSATPANARKNAAAKDEVKFNTGKHSYSVVSEEDFIDSGLGDACFEEDGSYTINIPEQNPFFPYEVEFTYRGKAEKKWFMTPEDEVEVGGHTFYVSAYFDGTVVTQMSLNVGGETVVVYPEKKSFTDEEAGAEPTSMLPLENRNLEVDLTAYTPVELTMVSVDEIFTGNELADGNKVIWSKEGYDDYTISMSGDRLDLSYDTYNSSSISWEMIVGDDNQLAADNIVYYVDVKVTQSANWLIPTIYNYTSGEQEYLHMSYYDYDDERYMQIVFPYLDHRVFLANGEVTALPTVSIRIGLELNKSIFPETKYDQIKVYGGKFTSASEAITSNYEIGHKLFQTDMTQVDYGYKTLIGDEWVNGEKWMTMVTFDAEGNPTGCLPFILDLEEKWNRVLYSDLQWEDNGKYIDVNGYTDVQPGGEALNYAIKITHNLYKGYAANQKYYQKMSCQKGTKDFNVIAAYVGNYASIQEAENAGAKDIKDELFNSKNGYGADYSNGIYFSIFTSYTNYDGTIYNSKDYYFIKTVEGEIPRPLSNDMDVYFYGLNDSQGNYVDTYIVNDNEDSYAEKNYMTMLVDEDVDLTALSPLFNISDTARLYANGSSTPEVSGESFHDFSKGPVQYTVSAQSGIESRNVWLQIVKAGVGNGTLYINSLGDEKASTKIENGVIYSTREMFLDGRYDYLHDIVLINLGSEAIPAISADLVSDEVELDEYWTLNGEYPLPDISNGGKSEYEQWNLAKLRIRPKDGMTDGRDINGTLTIKSEENTLMVLTLTGTVGDPGIMTTEIPQAVKYVPYGTIIQNNNKYSWNQVSYRLVSGRLPKGMEMKLNGELYGVPTEMGEFTFTVGMENTYQSFLPNEKTFTLNVIENTDINVDSATDEGYILTQRVKDMLLDDIYAQTLVSLGTYDEFTDVFLDGEKLEKGVDYTSEAGSTRITIQAETLKAKNTTGRHTLGIEFRTGEEKNLKRAAQNYEIKTRNQSGSGGNSSSASSGGSSSGGSRSKNDTSSTPSVPFDAKKGYYTIETGIITGEGAGYSCWAQDENGWKLIYADGTAACGYITQLADGTVAEQVLWEQINGLWYAFGITGYLKSGWVYDYQLNSWYCLTEEFGMYSGWYGDAQDNCVYYLEPVTGKLATGWRNINNKWYYFNEISLIPTWNFNAITGKWEYNALSGSKPYGAMYNNEYTPDGYFVGADGVWDGQAK